MRQRTVVKPIAVLCSDLHLQECAWSRRPKLCGDALFSYMQICQYAGERNLPVLAAGDLYNMPAQSHALTTTWAARGLGLLTNLFVYCTGDHDRSEFNGHWLSAIGPDSTLHLGSWHDESWRIYRLPTSKGFVSCCAVDHHPDPAQLLQRLREIPEEADLVLIHATTAEFMEGEFGIELRLSDLPAREGRLFVCGDVHKSRVIDLHGGMRAYSPGSTCLQAIDESEHKSFGLLLEDMTIQQVPLLTRPVLRYVVTDDAELSLALESLPNAVASAPELDSYDWTFDPIVDVRYSPSYAPDTVRRFQRVLAALPRKTHFFYRPLPRETAEEASMLAQCDEDVGSAVATEHWQSRFAERILETSDCFRGDPELTAVVRHVLRAVNAEEALDRALSGEN